MAKLSDGVLDFLRKHEGRVFVPGPLIKVPDQEMMDYIVKASEAVSKVCLLDAPRDIVIQSRIHDKDVVGAIMVEGEPIKFVTKIVVKPKIDWLAINRDMSNGSY